MNQFFSNCYLTIAGCDYNDSRERLPVHIPGIHRAGQTAPPESPRPLPQSTGAAHAEAQGRLLQDPQRGV